MSNRADLRQFFGIVKRALPIAIGIAAVALLFFNIYLTKTLTWQEVYDFFSLKTPSSSDTGAEGKEPSETPSEAENPGIELEGELLDVVFLSVGQGDCAYLECGGVTAFVDAGDLDAADDISAFIAQKGIKRVDYLFATHPHIDHIGSMDVILNSCEVGRFIMTSYDDSLAPTFYSYGKLLRQLLEKGVHSSVATVGESFKLGGATISVLSAGGFYDLNNCSLVLRLDYGEKSFLLTGDSEFECEAALLATGARLDCDVLKAGHHGSGDSSSGAFIAAASPDYAVISCGLDNAYGFPDIDVLNLIERQGAILCRTDTEGNITFLSDGKNIVVQKQRAAA